MSDWTQPLKSVLVAGMSGTGKTGFVFRYLSNAKPTCRFIFDDLGQCAARLGIPHASTANEMEAALQMRWVNYNPHRMFPGDVNQAFRFFCKWTFKASQRGRGEKIIFIDEIWRFQDRDKIPLELAQLSQMGRAENIRLVTATQHPHLVHPSLAGNLSELVCFKLQESVDLRKVRLMGANELEVQNLPLGSFISYLKEPPRTVRGRIF